MSPTELFDLPVGIGQMAVTMRWDLVTRRLEKIGELHPARDGNAINNDGSSSTPRTMTGVTIREKEFRDVNTLTDLVRPWWVLENDEQLPLGVFTFDDEEQSLTTTENSASVSFADMFSYLDQESSRTVSIDTNGSIRDTVISVIEQCGITEYDIADFESHVNDPYSQPTGTPAVRIIRDLLQQAGTLPPYFDREGKFRVRMPPNLATVAPDHVYDLVNSRVLPDKTRKKKNLVKAPNRFIVVGNGPNNGEIVAVVDVAPGFPNSKERNDGHIRTKTVHMNGIGSYDQAYQLGLTLAQQDPNLRQGLVFASSIDPRHDTFDVVQFDGVTYLEPAWSIDLSPGGDHTHTLTRMIDVSPPT